MSPPALATTDDLDARTIGWDDQTLAQTYLDVASAAIRDAAGCPITSLTSTIDLWPDGDSQYLRLPGPPVTSVTSVSMAGTALIAGTHYVLMDGMLYRPAGWQSYSLLALGVVPTSLLPSPIRVTYVHGLAEVPADVVDLVCRMTASALVAASAAEDGSGLAVGNVVSERLGDYSVTYNRDSGVTEMELTDKTRHRIAARFGGGSRMMTTR